MDWTVPELQFRVGFQQIHREFVILSDSPKVCLKRMLWAFYKKCLAEVAVNGGLIRNHDLNYELMKL